jgi:two-component system sensor histidine kinase YesM
MAEKLGELIEQHMQKQQICRSRDEGAPRRSTTHFMYKPGYHPFLGGGRQNKNVVTTTWRFPQFFRLSLNKGRDWVSVEKEISHVESYLAIQKMRYGAILEYEIDIAEDILQESMLKILLQPLVENSIYHGIKKTRRPGLIRLVGRTRGNCLLFTVEDNGLGMAEAELRKLRENLAHYDVSNPEMGFGLYNVYKRIQLYYQIEDGLIVESEYNKGSRVTLRLPMIVDPTPVQAPPLEGV